MDYTSTILAAESEGRHSVVKEMVKVIQKEDLALQMQSTSELEDLCRISDSVGWEKL